jgi:uroporphyrinogen-III synthase
MILLTRPYDDSVLLQKQFQRIGIPSLIEPLLSIEKIRILPIQKFLQKDLLFDGVVITSKHALDTLEALKHFLNLHCRFLCVGEKLNLLLAKRGVYNTQSFACANDLAAYLHHHYASFNTILYVRGEDITYDLARTFPEKIIEIVAYKTTLRPSFSKETLKAFNSNFIKGVMLYSKRSAKHFQALCQIHSLFHKNISAYCLSKEIGQCLTFIHKKHIHYPLDKRSETLFTMTQDHILATFTKIRN